MKKYLITIFKSKKDLAFKFDSFNKENNIIFITGLFGSGKSTLARYLAQDCNAIHVQQDFLTWSEAYVGNEECELFVNKFISYYPETIEYFTKRLWHGHQYLTKEDKLKYRTAFDKMVIEYAAEHKDQLFVFEGASLFRHTYTREIMKDYPIIIKRTSLIKSLRNMCRRDLGKVSLKSMYSLWHKNHKHWTIDRKILNEYIKTLAKLNDKNLTEI